RRINPERVGQATHDFEAGVVGACLQLGQITSTDLSFISEIVLRQAFCVSQTAQICREHLSQIHARSEALCSKCAPRYTEQNNDPGAAVDFELPYLLAMREQAPKMFKALTRAGKLKQHARQKSAEAHELLRQILAGDPNPSLATQRQAEEIVFATLIE